MHSTPCENLLRKDGTKDNFPLFEEVARMLEGAVLRGEVGAAKNDNKRISHIVGADMPVAWEVNHELNLFFLLGGPLLVALCPTVWYP